MANRRDLHISIDGDARGFDAACADAEAKARGFDRELARLERQQAAQEKVTTRTTAAVQRFATAEDKAALAARKMGLEVKRAAEQAEKAEIRAAAAAEAAAKGLLDEEKAARLAARADDAVERAAIKAAEAQLAQTAAAEKSARAQRGSAEAAEKHRAATVGMAAWLTTAGVAAAGLAVPVGAAGLAFVGMAAVAAPAVKKVLAAQENLGANWDTLDRNQKIAASSVQSLISDYKALAKSYEPEALTQFNGLVATARGLLPELGKTVDSTKVGFADFSTTVESSLNRQIPRLAGILQGQATPALHELGSAADHTASLAVNLVQGLAPMGVTLLRGTNGVLSLLNALTSINPRLTEFVATGIALRAPVTGLAGFVNNLTSKFGGTAEAAVQAASGVGASGKAAEGAAGEVAKLGTKARVAAAGTKLLNAVTSAGPGIYIAAAAGLAYLAVRMSSVRTATDGMIDRLRGQYQAFGNNVQGYKSYANALRSMVTQEQAAFDDLKRRETNPGNPHPAFEAPERLTKLKKALDDANRAQTNVAQGAAELAKEFNLKTTPAAIQLANAAGVDMSKGILKSGELTAAARQKITQYEAAVAAAADPTKRVADDMSQVANNGLLMQDRLKALTDALSAYYTPAQQAFDATTQLKAGWEALVKAMQAARGDFSGNTAKSRELRQALSQQLNTILQLYQANVQTKGYDRASSAAEAQVQVMYALAGNSKAAKGQIDALARSLQLSVGKSGLSKDAFMAAAASMHVGQARAEELWRAYNKLPTAKKTELSNNAKQQQQAIQDYQNKINSLHGKHVDIYQTMHLTTVQAYVNQRQAISGYKPKAAGGPIGYAHGGQVARMAAGGPSGPVVGPGSGTSDDIPVWLSNGEFVIRASQAKKYGPLLRAINDGRNGFAAGGPVARYAVGGIVTGGPLALSDVLQYWTDAAKPATKKDYDAALKSRRNEINKVKAAEDALYKARKRHDPRAVAAAERRLTAARQDLAAATSKLTDVSNRYKYAKLSPVQQLDVALSLGIKDNATFIKNLETLADRGFGDLAQKLLAMGGPQAEKIAASAVKLSTSKLKSLQGKINTEQQQKDLLANLPAVLSIRSAIKNTKGGISSWVALLNATGLDPASLSAAVKLMTADLDKTASGKALLADMHAHGYARGGTIVGPPGTDRVPLWGTAGEYVVNRQAAAANRRLLDAINTGARVPVASMAVRGGDGASAGPQINQTFQTRDLDTHQLARESAREIAWMLR